LWGQSFENQREKDFLEELINPQTNKQTNKINKLAEVSTHKYIQTHSCKDEKRDHK